LEPEAESGKVEEESEKKAVEGKYKLAFLQMDKRLVNLELALGELSEKIKDLKPADPEAVKAVQERLDELEDSTMVEQFGELELKRIFEGISSEIAELSKKVAVIPAEEIQRIESLVLKNVDEKMSALPKSALPSVSANQIARLQEDISGLGERVRLLETDVIQKVVSEVSELRTETSKEIRDIRDRMSGTGTIKPDIDIKFLSSRLNSLKESVEYMLNRKAELDMKIENLQKALAQLALKVEKMPAEKVSPEIPPFVEQRLSELEGKIGFLMDKLESRGFGGGKKGELPADVNAQIDELLDKIVRIESRLSEIEREEVGKPTKREPIIVE